MRFRDRLDAGQQLAARLGHLLEDPHTSPRTPAPTSAGGQCGRPSDDLVAVGMPRGGVPVAAQVARVLRIPLDVVLVRKLGVPFHPELAMGAIGEGGVRFVDESMIARLRISAADVARVEQSERMELARRAAMYRHGTSRVSLLDKTVIVIDDGMATGASARVACRVVRAQGARRVVLAVPIAPPGWEHLMRGEADELVAVAVRSFRAVGDCYNNFEATTDAEVAEHLQLRPDNAH